MERGDNNNYYARVFRLEKSIIIITPNDVQIVPAVFDGVEVGSIRLDYTDVTSH